MKILRIIVLTILVIVFCQAAWAQCPNAIGTWTTLDGSMLGGRASEAWCGADGNPIQGGQPGNTQNAMSWDGASLGTQWRAWGMTIDSNGAVLTDDQVDPNTGDGYRVYSTHYVEGQFWLSKDYSWSDGVADLTGDLTTFNVQTIISYSGGQFTGAVSSIVFNGLFDNCSETGDCQIEFSISNAMLVWNPAFGGDMPADYPDLLCGANTGEAFDICCIQLSIYCAVGAEETSWGSLKALYK